ncbi:hypothetical protein ACWGIN_18445 [Streptomyces sp. NPDC054861]
MTHPTRPRRLRAVARMAVALACAGVMSLTGLPGLQSVADAAPNPPGKKKQELCQDLFDLQDVEPTPVDEIPWDKDIRPEADWDEYFFDSQRQAMDGVILPGTPAEQKKVLDALEHGPEGYKEGDPRKVWASYKRFLDGAGGTNKYGTFDAWLKESYLEMAARGARGRAFHKKVVKDLGLTGPDWYCEEDVEYTDKDGNKRYRRYDAVNYKTGDRVEIKSGGNHEGGQRPKDKAVLKEDPKAKLRPVFGQEQSPETRRMYDKLSREVGNGQDGKPRIQRYEHRSTYRARYTPGRFSLYDPYMNPAPGRQTGSRGGGNDQINRSAPTPEDARRQIERARQLGAAQGRVRGPGGVDFTTLELRYVGKPVKGQGLDYSFSAKKTDEDAAPGYGGKEKAQLVSDSFFTWLALTPEKFWVNLNPDEPERVMDDAFAATDAGRVLLEADLIMKHDFAAALNPEKRPEARQYWDTAPRREGVPCFPYTRMWIEPKPAQVREQDGGIYILDAPLAAKAEWQETKWTPPGAQKCDLTKAEQKAAQATVNRVVMSEVERRVNNDPKYADLRRVYASRVAAEWIRQQDAQRPTDYRKIIDSNDVAKWPLRGENADWSKMDVYNRYKKTLTEGIEWFELAYGGKVYQQGVGGVDFSKAPKRNVTPIRFQARHKHLPRTTRTSLATMTDDAESEETLFLGGNTAAKASGGGGEDPTPTPTPTPSDPGTPTEEPSAPAPSTPGTGGTAAPQDPDGDLADTGSGAPVGLIAGLAAALAAVGGALVWWRRRATDRE